MNNTGSPARVLVPIDELAIVDVGWRYDDESVMFKLVASVRRWGQMRPVVVRTAEDGTLEVVDGRRLLRALREAGKMEVAVYDIGAVPREEALRCALALEIGFGVDYARLAVAVDGMLKAGASAAELSALSPFTAERIGYFGQLATFDWSVFSDSGDGQHAIDWSAGEDLPGDGASAEPDGPGELRPEEAAPALPPTAAPLLDPGPLLKAQLAPAGQLGLF